MTKKFGESFSKECMSAKRYLWTWNHSVKD